MARVLFGNEPGFEAAFLALMSQKRESAADVERVVAEILHDVRARGDAALVEYTRRLDRLEVQVSDLRISAIEIDRAMGETDPVAMRALEFAAERIRAFHDEQRPLDRMFTDALGVRLGWRWTALDAVGLYVPGGSASYPSSVLMNAIPAKVAGCSRLVMTVPAPEGRMNPLVLAAARLAGVDEIYRIGGAQAIGALAYGTASIAPVDKVFGPGNAYVAAAKRLVFGAVGIDMIAGPSEVVVVADRSANPEWIAADLLAQAEHDAAAQSILITDDQELAEASLQAVDRQLASLPRRDIAERSWNAYGAVIVVEALVAARDLVNRLAPEHLEVMTDDPDAFAAGIRHAGAIFLGHHTPEAIGDYVGGSNHVLPTARSARFASGLGVLDFMKRTSLLACGPEQLHALAPAAVALGEAEGLTAHARSITRRINARAGRDD